MDWLLVDDDVWSGELEDPLKKAITFDPTLDHTQIFTGVSRGCFPWVSYGINTLLCVRLVGQP